MNAHMRVSRNILMSILTLVMGVCIFSFADNAYATDVGGGSTVVAGGGSANGSTITDTFWTFGDFGSVTNSTNNNGPAQLVLNKYKTDSPNKPVYSSLSLTTSYKGSTVGGNMNAAIKNAVEACEKRSTSEGCKNPHLVAFGFMTVKNYKSNTQWGPSMSIDKLSMAKITTSTNISLSVNGNKTIKIWDELNGGASIASTANDKVEPEVGYIAVVIGEAEYEEQSGWYPIFALHKLADVASSNQLKTTQLEACPVDYSVTANGVDGYVKGQTVETQIYHTPYGYLYDAVAKGESWTAADGTVYGPFKGEWQNQSSMVDSVKEARNKACDETYNMTLDYDLGSGKTVSVSADAVPNEDTNGDGTIDSNDFLTRYAKGGIYKIIKQEKKASITVKESEPLYYKRESYYIVFRGWASCKKDETISADKLYPGTNNSIDGVSKSSLPGGTWNGNKCGHIGETTAPTNRPAIGYDWQNSDPRGFAADSVVDKNGNGTSATTSVGIWWQGPSNLGYNSVNAWHLTTRTNSNGVNEVKDAVLGTGLTTDSYGHWITWDDISGVSNETRRVSGVFSLGIPLEYTCADGKVIDGLETDLDAVSLATQKCTPTKWSYNNNHLAWNTKASGITWYSPVATNKAKFESGSEDTAVLNSKLIPVANNMQSYHTIMVQDYMHVNCNKVDLDNYVAKVKARYGDSVIQSVSSEKLSGDVVSAPQYPDASGSVTEPFRRALIELGDGNAATGYTVSAPNGSGYSATNYTTGYYNSTNGTVRDPFYTKECPFDCVDTSTTTSGNAISNVRDSGVDSTAKNNKNYGIKVQAADEKGNLSSDYTNTAMMTFFKTNAANAFTVDVWHPQTTQGSVTWDGSKAVSTTILSNVDTTGNNNSDDVTRNGTPWVINGKVLTNLSAGGTQLFNTTTDNVGTNMSLLTAANNLAAHQATLSGQVNSFTIKSPWASESGKNLKFNIKWEYQADNKVAVPAKFTIKANGLHTNHTADTVNITTKDITSKVDGQCYSNALNTGVTDTTQAFHDNTGYGSKNNLDTGYHEGGTTEYPFGHFEVNFVRATAE